MKNLSPLTQKKTLIFFSFLFLCLLAAIAYSIFLKKEVANTLISPVRVVHKSSPVAEKNTYTVSEKDPSYEISLTLPHIVGTDMGAITANDTIKKYYEAKILSFKKGIDSTLTENHATDIPVRASVYSADTTIVYEDTKLTSFLVNEFFDLEGSVHPSHTGMTFVYDKVGGKVMTLSDMYVINNAFYTKLETFIYSDSAKNLEKVFEGKLTKDQTDWIKEGLSHKDQSFKNFTLSDTGITFYFDEYVLAPYTAGPQKSFIPFDTLKEFKK